MRQCLTLLILIWLGTPAFADEAPPWKPSKIIVCEEIQSANPAAIWRERAQHGRGLSPIFKFHLMPAWQIANRKKPALSCKSADGP
jgi:hypothetical protein